MVKLCVLSKILNSAKPTLKINSFPEKLSRNNYKEIERVNMLFKPPIPIPYESSQIHHIYDVDVKNAPSFKEKLDEVMKYINEPDIII